MQLQLVATLYFFNIRRYVRPALKKKLFFATRNINYNFIYLIQKIDNDQID